MSTDVEKFRAELRAIYDDAHERKFGKGEPPTGGVRVPRKPKPGAGSPGAMAEEESSRRLKDVLDLSDAIPTPVSSPLLDAPLIRSEHA